MPDWRAFVRARIGGLGLEPTAEIDVVEELSQHVEDRYAQLRAAGVPDHEAQARSLAEIDGEDLLVDLLDVLPHGDK